MTPFIAELLGTALIVTIGDGIVANVVLPNTKGQHINKCAYRHAHIHTHTHTLMYACVFL